MAKFIAVKTINLDFLGSEWKDCYIKINSLTLGELASLASFTKDETKAGAFMVQLIKDKFVDGRGWDGKKVIAIKKEDIDDLPIDIFGGLYEQLMGNLPKKK